MTPPTHSPPTTPPLTPAALRALGDALVGELRTDRLTRRLYATDASVYRELPAAVAFPRTVGDLRTLVHFATAHATSLIARTAGTSLAGQCVGGGVVLDTGKHFTRVLDLDVEARTVTVEPGVIRDDLNRRLAPHGLFFAPNTSTADRCMVGGMVGNNSSGSTSIRYGVTRDKVLAVDVVLADGSEHTFDRDPATAPPLTGRAADIYHVLARELGERETRKQVLDALPHPSIRRRNTGYALDALAGPDPLGPDAPALDLPALLCGSEGTLALATSVTLALDPLPPPHACLVVAHFASIQACLEAVVPVMAHELYLCEMLDRTILDLTRANPQQARNRQLLVGDPAAILLLELRADAEDDLARARDALLATLGAHHSYGHPVLHGAAMAQVIDLRAAGLGILGNMIGDAKAVACIEDTAVALPDLAAYIAEFTAIMHRHERQPVYYAHAGAGELHLRPVLNLKRSDDVALFRAITDEVAALVHRYRGSMSGEHGDGIVRSGYIPLVVGERNYALMRRIKMLFDPQGILNPGKIVDVAPTDGVHAVTALYPMDERLRYEVDRVEPEIDTLLDFSDSEGILRLAEKCNGTGTCVRSAEAGGTMCPSYKVTRRERDSTRGRANVLREVLTHPDRADRFDSEDLRAAYDLCLSCKGCAHECPSTVDVGLLKAEFLYQYQKVHGRSLRSRLFANNDALNRLGRLATPLTNLALGHPVSSALIKRALGVAPARSLPQLSPASLRTWAGRHLEGLQPARALGEVYFFCDEFTDQLDAHVGIAALELLTGLGYRVLLADHAASGRAQLSKGFLEEARALAERNVGIFRGWVSRKRPLVGVEPSAILAFRDEYPRLVRASVANPKEVRELGGHALLLDEFLARERSAGRISPRQFDATPRRILLHGHCHQKALSDLADTVAALSVPEGHHVEVIPSGCCGMAGSFGYEAEHYDVSMAVGEQVLFPALRAAKPTTLVAAPGTSCRHQIADGAGRHARHPVEILRAALLTG